MKRIILCLTAFALVLALASGCERRNAASDSAGDRMTIVATLFPQYDFARQIGGDWADVRLLLPPGTESHSFEPTPGDIRLINDADLFLYTGADMEPWAQQIADSLADTVAVVDVSQGIARLEEADDHDHDEGGHTGDPHIWLDPKRAVEMLRRVESAMCDRDPSHAASYHANADAYAKEIEALDRDFEAAVKAGKRDTIVFGGRFAYQYFLERYKLHAVSAYDGCSTEAEPSVRRVAEVIAYIEGNGIPAVYHEEFVDPVVARSIAEQTGAKLLLFSTCHNVAKDELEAGIRYVDLMRRNLDALKEGLS